LEVRLIAVDRGVRDSNPRYAFRPFDFSGSKKPSIRGLENLDFTLEKYETS
jgi:hypothetical protein